jgi:hypothetical protein
MTSIRGRYEYSDGLTPGQSKDGGLHQNLYNDEGHLVDHARFIPDDEDEVDSLTNSPPILFDVTNEYASDPREDELPGPKELLGALVLIGAIVAVGEAAPHLKRWWKNQALPFIKPTWKRLVGTREADSQAATAELSNSIEPAYAMMVDTLQGSSQEAVAELEDYRASMSSAEARERFVAALIARLLSEDARLFSEEQIRVLRNARIEDLDSKSAMETLTPEQVGDGIRLLLEAKPMLLNELGKILGESQVDGGYVPLRHEKIKETPRLTDGEM